MMGQESKDLLKEALDEAKERHEKEFTEAITELGKRFVDEFNKMHDDVVKTAMEGIDKGVLTNPMEFANKGTEAIKDMLETYIPQAAELIKEAAPELRHWEATQRATDLLMDVSQEALKTKLMDSFFNLLGGLE